MTMTTAAMLTNNTRIGNLLLITFFEALTLGRKYKCLQSSIPIAMLQQERSYGERCRRLAASASVSTRANTITAVTMLAEAGVEVPPVIN
jgi:hypothetical protein